MEKAKMTVRDICRIKETLIDAVEAEIAKGVECVCTTEMGAVVDMIKDLAKAEKDCYEACFYREIVEAMEEVEEHDKLPWYMEVFAGRSGYDHYRYASGRYASKGHGHYVGYHDTMPERMDVDISDPEQMRMMRQGRLGYEEKAHEMSEKDLEKYAMEHPEEFLDILKESAKHMDSSAKARIRNRVATMLQNDLM